MTWKFFIRESASDVSGDKLLGEFAGPSPIEIDYQLLAGAPLGQVDMFLTAPPEPNSAAWQAGTYTLTLMVQNGLDVSFTIQLWRADLDGNDITQIGSEPAVQSGPIEGPQTYTFFVTDTIGQSASATDRMKLKLLAQNTDALNARDFSIMASQSSLVTPIGRLMQVSNNDNPNRRGRFLGNYFRVGEGSDFFDERGVDLQ